MRTAEIRQKFLSFFESKDHQIVASSPLVPGNDPTIMFTVAGMVQFKDVFLGFEKRGYTRATTSQKCLRAGGKHNDLENVGYTARHHTFFEMLGNFSFGDYFKRDAITYAWEFLTSPQWLNLPKDKLMVTVYASDDEAYDIWHKQVGLPAEKIIRIGDNKGAPYASDNFWTMGDTGPCGPCSEIFYDHGPDVAGGPPGSPDEDGDRYMEIWNNVFMQFNRDETGVLHPLPKPSVDTGMGLERLSTVLQNVKSNYETDILASLVKAAARETGVAYSQDQPSLKVIADHIRACAFLVADGVIPSNEGRGYVLRRIVRRAVRHGYKLGQKGLFFHKLVNDLALLMGDAYPQLIEGKNRITAALCAEEEQFARTLDIGMSLLEKSLEGGKKTLDGKTAFTLHSTYGFPIDLTADICRERELQLDMAGYERDLTEEQERGRAAGKFNAAANVEYNGNDTIFEGYASNSCEARVLALYKGGAAVEALQAGEDGVIVLDNTAFYAEGGGQVGDSGKIIATGGIDALFDVADTQKVKAAVFGHQGRLVRGTLRLGDAVTATIDLHRRLATARNHSATHLLHSALREVLGTHVQQKGSLVNHERTRFDFAHTHAVTPEEIAKIESVVNHVIAQNYAVTATIMKQDEALKSGAMALFGEKYGDEVRVLKMGNFSTELCGGTHVHRTGDIGFFKIVTEGGVAAGIRRVEAVTGAGALAYVQRLEHEVKAATQLVGAQPGDLIGMLEKIQAEQKSLEKELAKLKGKLAANAGNSLQDQVIEVDGVKMLAATVEGADSNALREMVDKLKDKLGSAAIVLASVADGKVALVAGVTPDLTSKLKAGELVNFVAQQVGGKGGGRPDMAMAGGTNPDGLSAALDSIVGWIKSK
ncbi:alanine--tRNA ligase [Chitinimonas sp. BJB300]|uniref:alanine--tRNA ligase n=1 Tax=Chitinimonas sp. BJB300 TaxID=1559339 RepID=UPI000C11BC87|nr:alanine--tRNA ligase [Chitinimonas sp. BJB300]PHV11167.1 alanine--tRNA ligase [Chitinimonas sp. BJB300]TSJ87431.1 alanine--tRNA ligase [Chitinimonas sp. BJB300]